MTTKELINSITEIELDSNCKVVAAKGYGTAKDFQKKFDISDLGIDNVTPSVSPVISSSAPQGNYDERLSQTGDFIQGVK